MTQAHLPPERHDAPEADRRMGRRAGMRTLQKVAASIVILGLGVLLCLTLRLQPHPVLSTGGNEKPLPTLTAQTTFVQKLVVGERLKVANLQVLLTTGSRPLSTSHNTIRVFDDRHQPVGRLDLPPRSFQDNSYVTVPFPAELNVSKGDTLWIALSSSNATASTAISAGSNESPGYGRLYVLRGDRSDHAHLPDLTSGIEVERTLCVQLNGSGMNRMVLQYLIWLAVLFSAACLAVLVWKVEPARRLATSMRDRWRARWRRLDDSFMKSRWSWAARHVSEDHLIRLDLKTHVFCAVGLVTFILFVAFGLHFSSIEMWNNYLPNDTPSTSTASLIAGQPKAIRSDEWMVSTPQLLHDYSGVPAESAARVARDAVSPWTWGFHLFGLTRGFAFWWDFWVFGCVYGFFFLMMLLSGNRFGLSLFAAFFVLFSSYNRWWDITGYVTTFSFALVGLLCFLLSRKLGVVWASFLVMCVFLLRFALLSYPAWQVTLGYLALFLVAGVLVSVRSRQDLRVHWHTKLGLALAAVVVGIGGASAGYLLNRETYAAMLATVYPGRRVSSGGGISVAQFFSGYLDPFMSEQRSIAGNICEASSFILLFPFVGAAMIVERLVARRWGSAVTWALLVYTVLLSVFMLAGFGDLLSRITMMSFVPSVRAFIGLGLASIMLMCLYLVRPAEPRFRNWGKGVLVTAALGVFVGVAVLFQYRYGFPSLSQSIWVCLVLATGVAALVFRVRWLFYVIMLVLVFIPSIRSNPVAYGLAPLQDKRLVERVHEIAAQQPEERWLAYGSLTIPEAVRAAGADVFNGVRFPPEVSTMKALDPAGKRKRIWNRFAHIHAAPTWRGPARFRLVQDDYYMLGVSPDDPALIEAGVDLFVVPSGNLRYFPRSRYRYLTETPLNGHYIIERKSE